MYLIQRCEDGMMIREFTGERAYRKEDHRNEECCFREIRRAIFDNEGYGLSAYYWGDYKHENMRWIKTEICSSSTYSYYYYYRTHEGRIYGRTLPDLAKQELRKTGLAEAIAMAK